MTKETLEEVAEKYAELSYYNGDEVNAFVNGAKWQAERMYSEEDMIEFSKFCQTDDYEVRSVNQSLLQEFNQLKKK